MEFEDILELLINPSEDGAPEDIFDQLRGAHTGALEGKDNIITENTSAMAELQAQVDALTNQLVSVKAANFDKLMEKGVPQGDDPDLNSKTTDDNESEGEMSTDDFFSKGD